MCDKSARNPLEGSRRRPFESGWPRTALPNPIPESSARIPDGDGEFTPNAQQATAEPATHDTRGALPRSARPGRSPAEGRVSPAPRNRRSPPATTTGTEVPRPARWRMRWKCQGPTRRRPAVREPLSRAGRSSTAPRTSSPTPTRALTMEVGWAPRAGGASPLGLGQGSGEGHGSRSGAGVG